MPKLTVGYIRRLLRKYGIYSQGGSFEDESETSGYEEFGLNSPLGEDFIFTIHYEDNAETLVAGLLEYAATFNPEEHAAMHYNNGNPREGTPSSLKDLLEDAEAIAEILTDAAKAANAALDGIEWDVDEIEDLVNLPSEVLITPERVADAADYLSDEYGYCVKSFAVNCS